MIAKRASTPSSNKIPKSTLRLRGGGEAHGREVGAFIARIAARGADWPELLFVLLDVIGQGGGQALGVLRRKDHPALHLRLGGVGYDPDKVHYELTVAVGYLT